MLYSKVFLRLHWGFSVSYPSTSKAKPSFYLPPPTTLIGALSYGKYRGVDLIKVNKNATTPLSEFKVKYATARIADGYYGTYTEDVIRNAILYFQRPERRLDVKYRWGVIPTGRVYLPNGKLIVVYLTDELDRSELEKLSWSINRLGSKESLVSVEDVKVGEAKKVTNAKVKTKYYFKMGPKIVHGTYVVQYFYDEVTWGSPAELHPYILPIITMPIGVTEVEVEAKEAYNVDGEFIVVS